MKKVLAPILMVALCVISCQESFNYFKPEKQVETKSSLSAQDVVIENLKIPSDAIIKNNEDGSVEIVLQNGKLFLITNVNGDTLLESTPGPIKVNCSCLKGSGCSVAKFDNQYFCIANEDCKTCTMTKSRLGKAVNIGGIIDPELGIKLMKDFQPQPSDLTSILYTPTSKVFGNFKPIMLQYKPIHDFLTTMYETEFPGTKPAFFSDPNAPLPAGYHYFKFSIYGNEVAMLWGGEIDGSGGIAVGTGGPDAPTTCRCEKAGQSGCKYSSYYIPLKGTVKYCDAGECSSCSMIN